MDDCSLYVPWNGDLAKMEEELETVRSIHSKNLDEFKELATVIKNSPMVQMIHPVKSGECVEMGKRYLEEERKNLETFEKYSDEYNTLLEEERKLLKEIDELEHSVKKVTSDLEKREKGLDNVKKTYQAQKMALTVAKKLYEKTFRMDISVEEGEGDIFKATVTFNGTDNTFPVVLTINRESNRILDFEANFLTDEESKQLKSELQEHENPPKLICALRRLILSKTN